MPIYEFYCSHCNTIYNFFSRRINTEKVPSCPKCENPRLQRLVSRFATPKKRDSDSGDDEALEGLNIDESKLEQAMHYLEREAQGIDEDDPRQAARLMRNLTEMTGLKLGDRWEEALSRLEAGEDPEAIEEELGDVLEGDDEEMPFKEAKRLRAGKKKAPPRVDETLYEL